MSAFTWHLNYPDTPVRLATLESDGDQYHLYISPNMEEKFTNWKIHIWYGNFNLTFQFEIYRPSLEIHLSVPSKFRPIVEGPVKKEQIKFCNLY